VYKEIVMAKKGLTGRKVGLFADTKLPKIANRSFRVTLAQPTWKDDLAALRRGEGSPLKKSIKSKHPIDRSGQGKLFG
jgi:hypothetical protein